MEIKIEITSPDNVPRIQDELDMISEFVEPYDYYISHYQ